MLDALLACPRCDNALTRTGDGHACNGCKADYPDIAGIPFLFAEPVAALGAWKSRLHMELRRLEHEAAQLKAALDDAALRAVTRQRITLLERATADHAERLRGLLEPLELTSLSAGLESYLALRTRLPTDQGLQTYYPNIHRDWCWGARENEAAAELVGDMLDAPPGRTLVLGAGPGRLAYDLHRRWSPELTVAMDFNPMLMLLAQRLARGDTVEMWEFPLAPIAIEDHARLRSLRAPEALADHLEFVIADASRPPFRGGAFETIITPWLTDILPEDVSRQVARVNHLLSDQGQWINFGSIAFEHADPARRYCLDELIEIAREQGFAHPRIDQTRIPYMASPASRHARNELVVTMAAAKTGKAGKPERYRALPDWLVLGEEPVPLTDAFRMQSASTRIHAFVMSMIDGKRSVRDMAALMEAQRLMPRDEAIPAIRSFLIRMLDDAVRG